MSMLHVGMLVNLSLNSHPSPVNPEKYRLSGFNAGVDPCEFGLKLPLLLAEVHQQSYLLINMQHRD